MNIIQAYKEQFLKHYPAKNVRVLPRKTREGIRFAVEIDGDKGDILLSENDMRDAIRMFTR